MIILSTVPSAGTVPAELDRLITGTARGDAESFAALYRETKSAVYALALSILRSHHDAEDAMQELFNRQEILVEKKGKNGIVEQDIVPMVKKLDISTVDDHVLRLSARVCCQNPSLNPMQLVAAVQKYLPQFAPDFSKSARVNLYDVNEHIFR